VRACLRGCWLGLQLQTQRDSESVDSASEPPAGSAPQGTAHSVVAGGGCRTRSCCQVVDVESRRPLGRRSSIRTRASARVVATQQSGSQRLHADASQPASSMMHDVSSPVHPAGDPGMRWELSIDGRGLVRHLKRPPKVVVVTARTIDAILVEGVAFTRAARCRRRAELT